MSKGVKMTGAEYRAFTAAEWGPDWYWDETVFLHNGEEVYDIGEVSAFKVYMKSEGYRLA